MDVDQSMLEVKHNEEAKRFEITVGEHVAVLDYQLAKMNIIFTHTGVPKELEGQGIGSKLAKAGLDYAVAQGYKIQPLCPFIASYVRRHAEYQPHVWHM